MRYRKSRAGRSGDRSGAAFGATRRQKTVGRSHAMPDLILMLRKSVRQTHGACPILKADGIAIGAAGGTPPGEGFVKLAAFVIKIAAVLVGLTSFLGLWAAVNDLRAAMGWWCVPVFFGGFAGWLWLWLKLARHMRELPSPARERFDGPNIALLDESVQSLALVLTLTTPFFIYLFVRGFTI